MQSNDDEGNDINTVQSDRVNLLPEDRNEEDDCKESTATAAHSADNVGSKWITKNLLVITVTFTFHFMAYNGLGNLQVRYHIALYTPSSSSYYKCNMHSRDHRTRLWPT